MRSARTWLPIALLALAFASPASAQRSRQASPIVQVLQSAPDARSRAQAALTLGELGAREAMPALQAALGDESAVVRSAAAQALGGLDDPTAVPALEARAHDDDGDVRAAVAAALARLREPPVDWSRARFVVGAGTLADNTRHDPARVRTMQRAIHDTLRGRTELVVRAGALPAAATARMRRGALRAYALDGGLNQLTRVADGSAMRAEVTFVIVSQPARTIVGMVQGAATARIAPGASEEQVAEIAVEHAVRGALRDLERALPSALR